MKKAICDKCDYEDTEYCCLYDRPCNRVNDCNKVATNTADAKIRTRAKRFLRRNGVQFENTISNSMLIALSKLCITAAKDAKEIERQKLVAMKCFDTLTPNNWMSANKIQVKEIMKQTGGYVVKWGTKYWVSFQPAIKRLSLFVFERSSCKEGDYYVNIVDSRTHHPYRDWE